MERAIAIAVEAHAGQTDRGGQPYILHPLRVMLAVPDEAKIAAVLHDVVEDSEDWSLTRLSEEGFSAKVLNAVECLTRRDDESYTGYIDRAASDHIARLVKDADLNDNMDMRRLPAATEADWDRHDKYRRARERLWES